MGALEGVAGEREGADGAGLGGELPEKGLVDPGVEVGEGDGVGGDGHGGGKIKERKSVLERKKDEGKGRDKGKERIVSL